MRSGVGIHFLGRIPPQLRSDTMYYFLHIKKVIDAFRQFLAFSMIQWMLALILLLLSFLKFSLNIFKFMAHYYWKTGFSTLYYFQLAWDEYQLVVYILLYCLFFGIFRMRDQISQSCNTFEFSICWAHYKAHFVNHLHDLTRLNREILSLNSFHHRDASASTDFYIRDVWLR